MPAPALLRAGRVARGQRGRGRGGGRWVWRSESGRYDGRAKGRGDANDVVWADEGIHGRVESTSEVMSHPAVLGGAKKSGCTSESGAQDGHLSRQDQSGRKKPGGPKAVNSGAAAGDAVLPGETKGISDGGVRKKAPRTGQELEERRKREAEEKAEREAEAARIAQQKLEAEERRMSSILEKADWLWADAGEAGLWTGVAPSRTHCGPPGKLYDHRTDSRNAQRQSSEPLLSGLPQGVRARDDPFPLPTSPNPENGFANAVFPLQFALSIPLKRPHTFRKDTGRDRGQRQYHEPLEKAKKSWILGWLYEPGAKGYNLLPSNLLFEEGEVEEEEEAKKIRAQREKTRFSSRESRTSEQLQKSVVISAAPAVPMQLYRVICPAPGTDPSVPRMPVAGAAPTMPTPVDRALDPTRSTVTSAWGMSVASGTPPAPTPNNRVADPTASTTLPAWVPTPAVVSVSRTIPPRENRAFRQISSSVWRRLVAGGAPTKPMPANSAPCQSTTSTTTPVWRRPVPVAVPATPTTPTPASSVPCQTTTDASSSVWRKPVSAAVPAVPRTPTPADRTISQVTSTTSSAWRRSVPGAAPTDPTTTNHAHRPDTGTTPPVWRRPVAVATPAPLDFKQCLRQTEEQYAVSFPALDERNTQVRTCFELSWFRPGSYLHNGGDYNTRPANDNPGGAGGGPCFGAGWRRGGGGGNRVDARFSVRRKSLSPSASMRENDACQARVSRQLPWWERSGSHAAPPTLLRNRKRGAFGLRKKDTAHARAHSEPTHLSRNNNDRIAVSGILRFEIATTMQSPDLPHEPRTAPNTSPSPESQEQDIASSPPRSRSPKSRLRVQGSGDEEDESRTPPYFVVTPPSHRPIPARREQDTTRFLSPRKAKSPRSLRGRRWGSVSFVGRSGSLRAVSGLAPVVREPGRLGRGEEDVVVAAAVMGSRTDFAALGGFAGRSGGKVYCLAAGLGAVGVSPEAEDPDAVIPIVSSTPQSLEESLVVKPTA